MLAWKISNKHPDHYLVSNAEIVRKYAITSTAVLPDTLISTPTRPRILFETKNEFSERDDEYFFFRVNEDTKWNIG